MPDPSFDCTADGTFANCSFEAGDLSGWVVDDSNSYFPAEVNDSVGYSPWAGIFGTAPSHQTHSARLFLDSIADGPIAVGQDVSIPSGMGILRFDWRCGVDLASNPGAPLRFEVQVQPAGGGAALQTDVIWSGTPSAVANSDAVQGEGIDISPYAGSTVHIVFSVWTPTVGQGLLELDNVGVSL